MIAGKNHHLDNTPSSAPPLTACPSSMAEHGSELEEWTAKVFDQSLEFNERNKLYQLVRRTAHQLRIVLSFPLFLLVWENDSVASRYQWRLMLLNIVTYGLPLAVVGWASWQPDEGWFAQRGIIYAKIYHQCVVVLFMIYVIAPVVYSLQQQIAYSRDRTRIAKGTFCMKPAFKLRLTKANICPTAL